VAAALVAFDVLEGTAAQVALALAGALALVFVVLVGRHRRIRARQEHQGALADLCSEGLLRLDREWEELEEALPESERSGAPDSAASDRGTGSPGAPGTGAEKPGDTIPPFAHDLDLLGRASLERLLGPTPSLLGRRTLRSWLLQAAPPVEAVARARAVEELAGDTDLRLEMAARGRRGATPPTPEDVDAFLEWAEEPPWTRDSLLWGVGMWLLPALTLVLGGLQLGAGWPAAWLLPFLAGVILLWRTRERVGRDLRRAARGAPALRPLAPVLRLLEDRRWEAPVLQELTGRLGGDGAPAHQRLDALRRRVDGADSRANLVYQSVNPFLLLDLHLVRALDGWRADSGGRVRNWLHAVGEMEALSALATLAHDHPDWTFPTWREAEPPRIEARALGHPLLPPDRCVRNDVEVGSPGSFLLVTGSNMSGKSTLLRALGTNVVLAGAGGPVCAEVLELPEVRLRTSMIISDSLEDGVSRFMAELLRVRDIVRAARETAPHEPPLLYLVDEILQGTNSEERRMAGRRFIRHLLRQRALGALTTHDLELHRHPEVEAGAVPVHFRESVREGEAGARLDFDYRLRPGLATTRNALELAERVGLTDPDAEDGGPSQPPE
jgi:energy-coupling factor transporter ATP-binding protein EcfA2